MKPKKSSKQDKTWRKKIEEQIKTEKVDLDHPHGKERFNRVIKKWGRVRKSTTKNS